MFLTLFQIFNKKNITFMLFLLIDAIIKNVIEIKKYRKKSIFIFLKVITSKIFYKSSYFNISTSLLVYLPKSLLV